MEASISSCTISFSINGMEKPKIGCNVIETCWICVGGLQHAEKDTTYKSSHCRSKPCSCSHFYLSRISCKRSRRFIKDGALVAMVVIVAMLMRKEKKGMKFTTTMLPIATTTKTLDMIFVAMIILDIFIRQMTLAMVIVNLATFILATCIAIITCCTPYIATLATQVLNTKMVETMVILMNFFIIIIILIMFILWTWNCHLTHITKLKKNQTRVPMVSNLSSFFITSQRGHGPQMNYPSCN